MRKEVKIVKEPMYRQLMKILRDLIQNGEFEIGDKFLTEGEISSRYEVSRNTVNKAMTGLISEGLLEFRKGLGSFIRMKHSQYDLHSLISFTRMAESMGAKAETKVLEFRKLASEEIPQDVKNALRLEESEKVYYMERLRLLDESPSILERRYVSVKLSPGLRKSDVSGSIISLWTDKYGMSLSGADQTLSAVLLTTEDAELLESSAGDPAMLRESTGFAETDQPLWFERTLFCGKDYVYRFKIDSINRTQATMREFVGGQDNN